ncbi:MAG: DUF1592 domain-containing protein [Opitutaceae bacterium]
MRAFFPFAVLSLLPAVAGAAASALSPKALENSFGSTVHPFLETYCITCHGGEKPKGDFDLSPYKNINQVAADFTAWDVVLEKLETKEMPSEKAEKFPSDQQRQEVIDWIRALRKAEAQRMSGDPGPVLARRLSNAEYDYTIKDLTGADIRPTKEFPVDPANQAGFDNSGESLAMSPALLKKYLGAAQQVAEHLVLQPEGFTFAPHSVMADTDRDQYSVLKIIDFYKRQPTDYADYFLAAWRFQNRAALGQAKASLHDVAARAKVSPKYLTTVWSALAEAKEEVGPMARLQKMWRELPPASPKGNVAETEGAARVGSEQMRDFVVRLRDKLIPDVPNLSAPPMQQGSQVFVLWKDRQMVANRRQYDPTALQVEGMPIAQPAAAPTRGAPAAANAANRPARGRGPANAAAVANAPATAPAAAAAGAAAVPTAPDVPIIAAVITDAPVAQAQAPAPASGRDRTPAIPVNPNAATSATYKMAFARMPRVADPDLVVPADPRERARYEAAFARFASLFPDAFYISERARVYADPEKEKSLGGRLLSAGLHSMTGFFRDDQPLSDLILDESGKRELDRLWREFFLSAGVPQRMHTSFVWYERTDSRYMQDAEFDPYRPEDKSVTTQEKIKRLAEIYLAKAQRSSASETVQQAIKEHFEIAAAEILRVEQDRVAAEPSHLRALQDFASRAYRRPLTPAERDRLVAFYREARDQNGLEHEDAMRDCIASVLMSPNFCYRIDLVEAAGATGSAGLPRKNWFASWFGSGKSSEASKPANAQPLSDYALASRLSYFLWSSMPDAELLAHATAGDLRDPKVLAAQARRMLKDDRVRNFATEFGGNWLDFRRFEETNTVDRERFPTFTNELRQAMFEEPVRFITDVVHEDRSVLNFIYGDYTFVNAPLAKHYGMPDVATGADTWVRFEHADKFERGGLLPMAVFLTANSPGLRTSPVKRGNWVVRRILGERIPPPPPTVAALPPDESKMGNLTLREALAKHREDSSCASCHARFDSFGLVFEGFGPVGERREKDLGDRPVDTLAPFPGGTERAGVAGLRSYLHDSRESDFVENLCRKLVAYGLGRTLLPSDDALIQEMRTKLTANQHRFSSLVESLVTSPQFLNKRPINASEKPPTYADN